MNRHQTVVVGPPAAVPAFAVVTWESSAVGGGDDLYRLLAKVITREAHKGQDDTLSDIIDEAFDNLVDPRVDLADLPRLLEVPSLVAALAVNGVENVEVKYFVGDGRTAEWAYNSPLYLDPGTPLAGSEPALDLPPS